MKHAPPKFKDNKNHVHNPMEEVNLGIEKEPDLKEEIIS